MKIRIKGNSVRYRLTKTEVETFCKTGYFEEKTEFKDKTLTYALKASEQVDNLMAEFIGETITMYLPKKNSQSWAKSALVGFQNTVTMENKKELFLLLEKDFACLDETTEDQSDNFPNPLANN